MTLNRPPTSSPAIRTYREVAALLAQRGMKPISGRRVEQIERAALDKLRLAMSGGRLK